MEDRHFKNSFYDYQGKSYLDSNKKVILFSVRAYKFRPALCSLFLYLDTAIPPREDYVPLVSSVTELPPITKHGNHGKVILYMERREFCNDLVIYTII